MVATRRGVRVYSPSKTNPEQSSDVQATPSTGRRTRRTAVQSESPPTKDALLETTPPGSSLRRCTRASRLHSPDQPFTPVGSCHEADTSDLESCCSAVSDTQTPLTRTRGRSTRKPRAASQEDGEISEVDSCSSAVSASQASQSSCTRSTRRKTIIPASSDPTASDQAGDMELGPVPPEVDSCGSAVSESQRVTRSQRKKPTTRTSRSVAKQPTTTEDSELSDADSCTSIISGMNVSQSAARRSTRSRRRTGPIPLHLDDTSEGSLSPSRVTQAARAKAAADVSEPQSCESEGFESGPSYSSITTRRRGKSQSTPGAKAAGSDSDLTDVHSPVGSPRSTRSRGGTPCSSRAGSGNSSRSTRASRHSLRDLSIVLEKALVPATGEEEETASLNDSMLEDTVIGEEDADCTLLEDNDKTQHTPEETESVNCADITSVGPDAVSLEKGVVVISDEDSNVCPLISEEAVIEAAVAVGHQQEEPCAENKHGDTSEMEEMQETVEASEPVEPCQSMTVTLCEGTAETTEEKVEAVELADADFHPPQGNEDAAVETRPCEEEEEKMEVSTLSGEAQQVVDSSELQVEKEEATELADADLHPPQGNEGATMETRPCEEREEKMEVSTLSGNAHQVVDSSELQVESIQVTSSQRQTITVESRPEQQSDDVTVENRKIISLLESSEDEDESAEDEEQGKEEREVSEEEDYGAEDRAGLSSKSEAAAASASSSSSSSVDGLFMIDTRPGQQADEDYYKTKAMEKEGDEQEEQDEEFVDEEGDEDENADILFSSRNPHLKEMSSRIDPGIRLKELGGLYINFDGSKSKPVSSSLQKLKEKKIQDEVMKKSVIGPDFEKKDAVPPYSESKEAAKLKRRVEREKSTGDGWFNMKAPEITQELKGDLNILKMRSSMDPKRFYKKNDRDGFPKYFQVGTVVDNPVDFYHSRIAKKDRKRTMVEELLSDAQFRQNNKKKYQQIVTEKAALGAGRRNNNKKKKFHKK